MELLSKKSALSIKAKNLDSKKSSFFEKAKSLFLLDNRAEAATERTWDAYITNRLKAEHKFRGPKEKRSKSATDEDKIEDDEEEVLEDEDDCEKHDIYALKLIRKNMAILENEMELDEGVLTKSFRVLECDALFEEEDQPRTLTTLTRIYSSTRPTYIDVHFQYHCRPRYYSIEWSYSLGFKIYNRPGTNDYHPPEISKFEKGRFDRAYTGNGWRSIAYGFFDDCGEYGEKWVRAKNAMFVLGEDDVKDTYEALWGPLDDSQGDNEDEEMHRRSKMVNTVRVLMAAAGIGYIVSIDDHERDDAGNMFMLEGLYDRWFARGVRKACGFQLERDPENEKKGLAEREEEMNRNDYDDEYNSDEGGTSDEEVVYL